MRAREFVINIPIHISMNGDGTVDVSTDAEDDAIDPSQVTEPRVMIPPLQQDLEVKKAQAGKLSPVIRALTQDEIDPNTER